MPVAARKTGAVAAPALNKRGSTQALPTAAAAATTASVKRSGARGTEKTTAAASAAALAASAAASENHSNAQDDSDDSMVITEEDIAAQESVDVQYNPELLASILSDLEKQVQIKCTQIQKDADFMATSIQQAFHLELIKLPTQVKQMSLARFREEFGDSLEAVTRGAIGGSRGYSSISGGSSSSSSSSVSSAVKSTRSSGRTAAVLETPSASRRSTRMSVAQTPSRGPREGEQLLSANGSPLGEFQTVVKAGRPGPSRFAAPAVPATPGAGLFVPLQTGDVLDMENADIDNMSQDVKQDALAKMQEMMANMQALMEKLKN